jgi:hypothetical protein
MVDCGVYCVQFKGSVTRELDNSLIQQCSLGNQRDVNDLNPVTCLPGYTKGGNLLGQFTKKFVHVLA